MKIKNYLLLIALISVISLKSQDTARVVLPIDENTKLITYKEVVTMAGTAAELYDRGEAWIKSYYSNWSEVTNKKSKEEGFITGTHRFQIYSYDKKGAKLSAGMIGFNFRLEFKEGRYRYIMTDFNLRETSYFPIERWLTEPKFQIQQYNAYLKQIDEFAKKWTSDVKKGMEPKKEIKDEW